LVWFPTFRLQSSEEKSPPIFEVDAPLGIELLLIAAIWVEIFDPEQDALVFLSQFFLARLAGRLGFIVGIGVLGS